MKKFNQLTFFLTLLILSSVLVQAEIIFSDNFNVTSSGDVNVDYNIAGRRTTKWRCIANYL